MASDSIDTLREIQERMSRLRSKTANVGSVVGNSFAARENREQIVIALGEMEKGITALAREIRNGADPDAIKAAFEEMALTMKELRAVANYLR